MANDDEKAGKSMEEEEVLVKLLTQKSGICRMISKFS
jgi:hypothetical protein